MGELWVVLVNAAVVLWAVDSIKSYIRKMALAMAQGQDKNHVEAIKEIRRLNQKEG